MLKKHTIITTDDGYETLHSTEFAEACHSSAGAYLETEHVYLEGCQLKEKIQTLDQINILEVGFGTGTGFLATYNLFLKMNALSKLNFISLEYEQELIEWSTNRLSTKYQINLDRLQVIQGDARKTIKNLVEKNYKFDGIYQDAFSPKKNPALWTVEWFSDLKQVSHNETILSTYSASSRARKSLIQAGWVPEIRAGLKNKGQTTSAKLSGQISETLLQKLKRSEVSEIYDRDLV